MQYRIRKSTCWTHTTKDLYSPHALKSEIKSRTHLNLKLSNETQENKAKWTRPSEV